VGCDDGDPCTVTDECSSGVCAGTPKACDSPPSPSVCYESKGTCSAGTCSYGFADGASCDDGNACTQGDTCSSGVCAGTAPSCTGGDGCCPSGCTATTDSDCDPFDPLVGRAPTVRAVCNGIFYTRCDPNQPPSHATCKGYWTIDRSYDITLLVSRGDSGDTQLSMIACQNVISPGSTCGQGTTPGVASFERASSAHFRAANVLEPQGYPHPFKGSLSVYFVAEGIRVNYSGDSGWVSAGGVMERGFQNCSGLLRPPF
jgi:hypothetical protein